MKKSYLLTNVKKPFVSVIDEILNNFLKSIDF